MKLNAYHKSANAKSLEVNKRMPKMTKEEFIEQSKKIQNARIPKKS